MSNKYDAVVVGSGPNGLAAAITLARAGRSVLVLEANSTIGGGARSAELTLPGFVHDVCSAVHPFALMRFGLLAICPTTFLAKLLFKTEHARSLFAGIAAHSFLPLEAPASSAFALVLGGAGHVVGWPIPSCGSQTISNALAAYLQELGGEIKTNCKIDNLEQLAEARAVLFDTSVWNFVRIAGNQLPDPYRRRLQKFRHAPGIFKIDYALSAAIPWRSDKCRRAGTIHLGGTLEEIAAAERDIAHGKLPERPFVLVAQQSLFDETRSPHGQHTLWAYAHVPFDSNVDVSEKIEAQIERFAPGFRDCILARHKTGTTELEKSNANLAGGDISGGAANLWQLIARPVFSQTPYRTPLRGVYLCSSSTPPGGGVHGMCGYHAARAALHDIFAKR